MHQVTCIQKPVELIFTDKRTAIFLFLNLLRMTLKNFTPNSFNRNLQKSYGMVVIFQFSRKGTKNKKNSFFSLDPEMGTKNFKTAAQAFCKVADQCKGCRLVIAGSPPKSTELAILRNYENLISWVEFPDEERLRSLYAESVALLYISKYEGFGMPLLEAMSQGCIPIAGNHSSIPEVLGEAGIKVNCESADELSEAMEKCLVDDSKTKSLVKRGYDRAFFFTWQKSAELHADFYKNL